MEEPMNLTSRACTCGHALELHVKRAERCLECGCLEYVDPVTERTADEEAAHGKSKAVMKRLAVVVGSFVVACGGQPFSAFTSSTNSDAGAAVNGTTSAAGSSSSGGGNGGRELGAGGARTSTGGELGNGGRDVGSGGATSSGGARTSAGGEPGNGGHDAGSSGATSSSGGELGAGGNIAAGGTAGTTDGQPCKISNGAASNCPACTSTIALPCCVSPKVCGCYSGLVCQ